MDVTIPDGSGSVSELRVEVTSECTVEDEVAIAAAWAWLTHEKGNVSAVEVIAFVKARSPGVDLAFVREALWQRLRASGGFASDAA
jgi:hypothetical protein